MESKAAVVNVFAMPYKVWTRRRTTIEEAMELHKMGSSMIEALEVKDKVTEVVSTHTEAVARMLRVGADTGLERHIDDALDTSAEYRDLRALMLPDVPDALSSYQCAFSEGVLTLADEAIKAHGVEIAEGQLLFHGGHWPNGISTFNTSRPFSTSFCPQVALRNAEWKGKAYDAGRVDLMVVCVTRPKTKAYAYSREGSHGNEKEVVFAAGAQLTRVHETYIADTSVYKMDSGLQQKEKIVPAYLVEVEIS